MKQYKLQNQSQIQNGINYFQKLQQIFLFFKDINVEKEFLQSVHIKEKRLLHNTVMLVLQIVILCIEIFLQQNSDYIIILIGVSTLLILISFFLKHYIFQICLNLASHILFSYFIIEATNANLGAQDISMYIDTNKQLQNPIPTCYIFKSSYHRIFSLGQVFGMFQAMTNDNFITDFSVNIITQLIMLIQFPQSIDIILLNIGITLCLIVWKYFVNLKKRINYLKYQYQLKYIDLFQSSLPFKIVLTHYDKIQNTVYPLSLNQQCAFKDDLFENQATFYEYLENHSISRERSNIHFQTQKKGKLDLKSYLLERYFHIEQLKEKHKNRKKRQDINLHNDSVNFVSEEHKNSLEMTQIDTLYTYENQKKKEQGMKSYFNENQEKKNNEFNLNHSKECIVRVSLLSMDLPYLVLIFFDNVDSKVTQNLKDQIKARSKFIKQYSEVIREKQFIVTNNHSKYNQQLAVHLLFNNLTSFNYFQMQKDENRIKITVEKFEISTLINYLKGVYQHKIKINCNEADFIVYNDFQCLKYICASLCSTLVDSPYHSHQQFHQFCKTCVLTISVVKYKLYTSLKFSMRSELLENHYPIDHSDSLRIPQQNSQYDCLQNPNNKNIIATSSQGLASPSILIPSPSNNKLQPSFHLGSSNFIPSQSNLLLDVKQMSPIKKRSFKMRHTLLNPQNAMNENRIHNSLRQKSKQQINDNQEFIQKLNNSLLINFNKPNNLQLSQISQAASKSQLKNSSLQRSIISYQLSPQNHSTKHQYNPQEEEFESNHKINRRQNSNDYNSEQKQNSPQATNTIDKDRQNSLLSTFLKNNVPQINNHYYSAPSHNKSSEVRTLSKQISRISLSPSIQGNKKKYEQYQSLSPQLQLNHQNNQRQLTYHNQNNLNQSILNQSNINKSNLNQSIQEAQFPNTPETKKQDNEMLINFNLCSYYSQIEMAMIKKIIKKIGTYGLKEIDKDFEFEILSDISSLVQSPLKQRNDMANNDRNHSQINSPNECNWQKAQNNINQATDGSENSVRNKSKMIQSLSKIKSFMSSKKIISFAHSSQHVSLGNFEEESKEYSSQQESIRINEHPIGFGEEEGIGQFLNQFNFDRVIKNNVLRNLNSIKPRRYSQSEQVL